jgi:hypothetical protein
MEEKRACGGKEVHDHIMWILGKKALWSSVFVFCCAALSHKFMFSLIVFYFYFYFFVDNFI